MSKEIKEVKKYLYDGKEYDTYEEAALCSMIEENSELANAIEYLGGDMRENEVFQKGDGMVLVSERSINKAKSLFIALAMKKYNCKDHDFQTCLKELYLDDRAPNKLYLLGRILDSIFYNDYYGWVRVSDPCFVLHFDKVKKDILKDISGM